MVGAGAPFVSLIRDPERCKKFSEVVLFQTTREKNLFALCNKIH